MKQVYRPIVSFMPLMLLCMLLLPVSLRAQQDSFPSAVLSEQDLLNVIRTYHPLVKQADYSLERAEAAITASRGGFDPVLDLSSSRKRFGGDLYYSYYNPELVIPTWYGIEIYGGLENVNGGRVNSESSLGKTSYLGVSVPLLKDLVIDKRRAALQQAKIYLKQSAAERTMLVNDLLFDALEEYWNWVKEYQVYSILTEAVSVNENRMRFIRIEYQQGNRPAIDTVEALAQLQQFQLMQNDAWLKFRNAGLRLSAYLWKADEQPYLLPEQVRPDSLWMKGLAQTSVPVLDELLLQARNSHPKLQSLNYKVDWLQIDQKLKFQSMLPKLDLKANLLNKGYNVFDKVNGAFLENNYKFGVDLSIPLRLSEGRGSYRQAKLKVAETGLETRIQLQALENKVKSYYNDVFALRQQVKIGEGALQNYQRLLQGEQIRFQSGESTLFLLNSRENKTLEALQKLAELQTKYYKSRAGLLWAAGQLR